MQHSSSPSRAQEVCDRALGIFHSAEEYFGHVRLPISVDRGRITSMSAFSKGEDPLQLLVDKSIGMQARGIQRQAPSLRAELRAYSGGDILGVDLASSVRFGDCPWTDNGTIARLIDENFPTVVSFDIKRPNHSHRKGDYSVMVANHGLGQRIWNIFKQTVEEDTSFILKASARASDQRLSFNISISENEGAYAVLEFCQKALLTAHNPRIQVFATSHTPLTIETWELGPYVERFFNHTQGCREAFEAYDAWWEDHQNPNASRHTSNSTQREVLIPPHHYSRGGSITYC
jgi:hypothetical protein